MNRLWQDLSLFVKNNDFLVWLAFLALALTILYRHKVAEEWRFFCSHRRQWFYQKWKNWGEPFLIALLLAIVIRTYVIGPYKIPTGSMMPTFMIGDRIFVDKISYRFHGPERGDVIVFKYPLDEKKDFVKRLVGLPGDEIEIRDGRIYVNGRPLDERPFSEHFYYNREDWPYGKRNQIIKVPEGHYFVLGDNSAQSSDSRNWGFVPAKELIGKAVLIWWPPHRIQLVK